MDSGEAIDANDAPDALVRAPTPHSYLEPDRGARLVEAGERLTVRYAGAGAAAVLDGEDEVAVLVDGEDAGMLQLDGPQLYELIQHERHGEHELSLVFGAPARAYAFSFAPAVAESG